MKHFIVTLPLLLCLAFLSARQASAASCTTAVTVGATSAQIFTANDTGAAGRKYMLLNNIGANPAYCAMGTSNAATITNGIFLAPYVGVWEPGGQSGATIFAGGVAPIIPPADVACISVGAGTTVVACDF